MSPYEAIFGSVIAIAVSCALIFSPSARAKLECGKPLITIEEAIELGRQEIINEIGQCDSYENGTTIKDCAANNGWDLKNG